MPRSVPSLVFLLAFAFFPHATQAQARTVVVHAHRFAFEPGSITIHRGETIRLRLVSDDVPHSLVITSLGINIPASKSRPGEVDFTATHAGNFAGHCGRFCGRGHGRMVFTVHVTEK